MNTCSCNRTCNSLRFSPTCLFCHLFANFFFKTSRLMSTLLTRVRHFSMINKCRLHIFSLAKQLIRSPLGFLLWVSCSVNAGQAHQQAVPSVAQRLKETLTLSWTFAWRSTVASVSFTLPLSKWSMRTFPYGGMLKVFCYYCCRKCKMYAQA